MVKARGRGRETSKEAVATTQARDHGSRAGVVAVEEVTTDETASSLKVSWEHRRMTRPACGPQD